MKICAISDLHGYLPKLEPCDYVFICGDTFPLFIQRQYDKCLEWLQNDFSNWINNLDCQLVFIIAGNHDFFFNKAITDHGNTKDYICDLFKNTLNLQKVIYLQDSAYTLPDGKTVYGCPWCTGPMGWAFISPAGIPFEVIPNDCTFLLTHQPPRIQKLGCSYPNTNFERDFGSIELYNNICSRNIDYNFCGHIHTGDHSGVESTRCKTKFYNVSLKDEDYKITFKPLYLTIE